MTQEVGSKTTAASEAGEPITSLSLDIDDTHSPYNCSKLQYPYEDTWD
jgi:hypothetical protein